MSDIKYFDIHSHLFPPKLAALATYNLGNFYNFKVSQAGTVDDYISNCREAPVVASLILCTCTTPKHIRQVNEGGLSMCSALRDSGLDSYVFGGYHQDCSNPDEEFRLALDSGIRGFKIHPDIQMCNIDDPRFFPLYGFCESEGLPVYIHMGDKRAEYRYSEAARLARICEKYPDLVVGAAHLGSYSAWEDSKQLIEHKNVWFDTSSTLSYIGPQKASEIIHMLGPDRCMFGTDYPVVSCKEEIERFEQLELTDAERRAIAYENACRFLKLK